MSFDRVIPSMLRMAKEGDVQKQYDVAIRYLTNLYGEPTSAEVQEGMLWLLIAAKQGHTESIMTLGRIHIIEKFADSGSENKLAGVTRDIGMGLKLYLKAISQGDPNAEQEAHWFIRRLIFDEGKDSVLPELRKAAEQGNPLAQSCLGEYYMEWGNNIPEARKWLTKAAECGIETAARNLKNLH